ncbi:MAG: hypothetical protein IT427_04300, partial [Pirellulales bacterium]|nr:hypothetical protein [Pirellulales bacterium]
MPILPKCLNLLAISLASLSTQVALSEQPWAEVPGGDGSGRGAKIVLVSGDEEYRSEDMLPQ